jgi:aspartate aminotransferase
MCFYRNGYKQMKKAQLSERVTDWSILPSAALHGKILELQNRGEKIIDLTIGISDRPIPVEGKNAAISAIKNNHVFYTAVGGDNQLKREIKNKLKNQNKLFYDYENIIVTTGAKQAIFEALYVLTNPGDKVAIIKPYWPAYMQAIKMLKLEPFIIDIDDVSSNKLPIQDDIKILLFDLPHNPTGKVFSKQELINLISFAKKNSTFIIADESYEKLVYEGKQISLATLDESMRDRTLTIFSASQSFSMMGWRLGYALGNKEIISAMEGVQSSITAAPPYLSQISVAAALQNNGDYTQKLVADFKKRRDVIYPKLKEIKWLTCTLPESGPYFWCNIEKLTKNSVDFAKKILEGEKIAIMPGEPFGAPGWIRIAFNVQKIPVLRNVVKRLAQFGNNYEKK